VPICNPPSDPCITAESIQILTRKLWRFLCNLIVVYAKKDVKVCGEKLSHRYIHKKVVEFFSATS
jgi:hypothetical protein